MQSIIALVMKVSPQWSHKDTGLDIVVIAWAFAKVEVRSRKLLSAISARLSDAQPRLSD